jgi:putative ABC transport system permease protein
MTLIRFTNTLRTAANSLLSARLRSALTALSITLGTAAFTASGAIGTGARQDFDRQMAELGAGTITIDPAIPTPNAAGYATAVNRLGPADVAALRDSARAPELAAIAAVVNGPGTVSTPGKSVSTTVVGTEPAWMGLDGRTVATGRFTTVRDINEHGRVAVVGTSTASALFGRADPIGRWITIGAIRFQIVGTFVPKGGTWNDRDAIVVVPWTSLRDATGDKNGFSTILVQPKAGLSTALAASRVRMVLDAVHPHGPFNEPSFTVRDNTDLVRSAARFANVLRVIFAVFSGIALSVGALGLANILIVTVHQRRREIAVRRAVGARRTTIGSQFVVESVLLCTAGGSAGIAATFGLTRLRLLDIRPVVDPRGVVFALAAALAVGLVAGLAPALAAARLDPSAGLRTDG